MTPCEKLGYKEGDQFVMLGDLPKDCFSKGSIIELVRDDTSTCPYFKLIEGECEHEDGGAYEDLPLLLKIETGEDTSDNT